MATGFQQNGGWGERERRAEIPTSFLTDSLKWQTINPVVCVYVCLYVSVCVCVHSDEPWIQGKGQHQDMNPSIA